MTDTLTARPKVPAWLKLDAIILPALREELHAHAHAHAHAEPGRPGWLGPMLDWAERALTLGEE